MDSGSGLQVPRKSPGAAVGRREVTEPGLTPRGSTGLGAKPSTSLKMAEKQFPPGQEARPRRTVCGCVSPARARTLPSPARSEGTRWGRQHLPGERDLSRDLAKRDNKEKREVINGTCRDTDVASER